MPVVRLPGHLKFSKHPRKRCKPVAFEHCHANYGLHCQVLYLYLPCRSMHPEAWRAITRLPFNINCLAVAEALANGCATAPGAQNSFADCTPQHYNVARRTIIWEIEQQSRRFTNSVLSAKPIERRASGKAAFSCEGHGRLIEPGPEP